MMPTKIRDKRGQAFVEALIVFPLLFMLFTFIIEMGYLMYDWAILNYYVCNAAEAAATKGEFSGEVRVMLADRIAHWTVNGQALNYDVAGTDLPGMLDANTVYIYGTDMNTPIQRGSLISASINFPWHFKFFMVDSLMRYVVNEDAIRLKVNAAAASEVYIE